MGRVYRRPVSANNSPTAHLTLSNRALADNSHIHLPDKLLLDKTRWSMDRCPCNTSVTITRKGSLSFEPRTVAMNESIRVKRRWLTCYPCSQNSCNAVKTNRVGANLRDLFRTTKSWDSYTHSLCHELEASVDNNTLAHMLARFFGLNRAVRMKEDLWMVSVEIYDHEVMTHKYIKGRLERKQ